MPQLLIKIVAISTKNFLLESIEETMKYNMPQRLLLFPSNKHKKFEMQKHKIVIILMLNANIVTRPQNPNK
jgi:hypothetical protein